MSEEKCTLTNEQLLEKCSEWISKLCKSGGKDWCLRVPVDLNHDPDVLFTELANRFVGLTDIISLFCEDHWVCTEKNTAVKWSRFDQAVVLRERQKEIERTLTPIYDQWVEKHHPLSEEERKLDDKDKEILRLRNIIKELQNQQ